MRRKKKKIVPDGSPEEIKLFNDLCAAFQSHGIETRVEKGNFRGGLCVVEGEKEMFFFNKKHTVSGKLALILTEIKKHQKLDEALPENLQDQLRNLT